MNKLSIALAALLLVIGVIGGKLWLELRAEREQGRQLVASAGAPVVPPPPVPAPVAGTGTAAEPIVAGAPAAAPTQPAEDGVRNLIQGLQETIQTEAGQEFMRTILETSLRQQYPDLAKELGISQAEADKFIALLASQGSKQAAAGANLQADAAQDPAARQEQARQRGQLQQANQAEQAAMLGDAYPKWQAYQQSAGERQRANATAQQQSQLRAAIDFRDNPVSDTQFKALTDALQAEQQRINQESRGQTPRDQMQRMEDEQRRLIDVARVYLNAGQLERYQRHLAQQADMARTIMGFAEAQGQ
jgi:hypothetical protein